MASLTWRDHAAREIVTLRLLPLLIIPGGLIDFFPIHNTGWSEVTYKNDPFIDWLKKNTSAARYLSDGSRLLIILF